MPQRLTSLATRRLVPWASVVIALLAVTGCTSVSRSTSDAVRLIFQRPDLTPTPEQVEAVPYPQLMLRSQRLNGVLVLGYLDQGRQAWVAGREAVYYLESNGLVSGEASPGRSSRIQVLGENPFRQLATLQGSVTVQRRYDWMPGYRYGVTVTGQLHRVGVETITLPNRTLQLTRYEETLRGPGLSGTNIYWADPQTGFIWKSRQYLAPDQVVEIEQLKPYLPKNS